MSATTRNNENVQSSKLNLDKNNDVELLKDLTTWLFKAGEATGKFLTPYLIGPTAVGKTTRIQKLAESLGLKLIILLPHCTDEDWLLGLPKTIDQKTNGSVHSITHWTIPEWYYQIAEEGCLLFIDEADKCLSIFAIFLTLMADRNLRGLKMHKDSRIVLAGQPVIKELWLTNETLRALITRVVFVPITENWSYLEKKYFVRLPIESQEIDFPKLPLPDMRRLETLLWLWRNKAPSHVIDLLLSQFHENHQAVLKDCLQNRNILQSKDLVDKLLTNPKYVWLLNPHEIIQLAPTIWYEGNAELVAEMTRRIILGADVSEDEEIAFHRAVHSTVFEAAEQGLHVLKAEPDSLTTDPEKAEEVAFRAENIIAKIGYYEPLEHLHNKQPKLNPQDVINSELNDDAIAGFIKAVYPSTSNKITNKNVKKK